MENKKIVSQFYGIYFRFSLFYFIFFIKINIILNECNRSHPYISNEGKCISYCSYYKLNNKCFLDNSILIEQYLNNIIFVGYNYFNFLTFSNGDFIFQTYNSEDEIIFFGLKNNGGDFFKIIFPENRNNDFFSNSIYIKDGKEYFLNFDFYIEIYDFSSKELFYESKSDILGFHDENYRGNLIYLFDNIYIYSGLKYNYSISDYQPVITKFQLNLYNDDYNKRIKYSIINNTLTDIKVYSNMISCFKTEKSGIIICFCVYNENPNYYYIAAYTQHLEYLCKEENSIIIENKKVFIYSIVLKDDVGAFIYYENNYPIIFFREYDNKSFKNYFEQIILDKYYFDFYQENNDLIRISNDKLGFFSVQKNLGIIYVVIIHLFNNEGRIYSNHVKIRYYSIEMALILDYNNYKLSGYIKAHLFNNNFIIIGLSYNNRNYYNYYSPKNIRNSFMIIGYPNKTDSEFDILDYIKINNSSISNLMINLTENMKIDNNIFGYIYKGIKIHNINKTGTIYLVSDNNEIINNKINSELYNSILKIKFENNSYIKSEYKIEYSIIVTESNFAEYEKYPIYIKDYNGEEIEEIFNKNKKRYIGKTIYYDIILKENLSENCNNPNCSLCIENNSECIIFKSELEALNTNNIKYKTDLELLYSTIIIVVICIIPYFLFSSFHYLRIIFYILQFIIFCIITFNSKYKNHYLWENTEFEPIQVLSYPIITDIQMKLYPSKYLYDLNISNSYQKFSIIKTEVFSKECLLNYYIKENEICPITDIIINDKVKNYTDYSVLESIQLNISYKRNFLYGQLYKSYDFMNNKSFNIYFQPALNYKDISIIKTLENNKLLNPFSRLKSFCLYCDYIWFILFPISLMYYLMESRNDKKWNYFRIIDYILQLILIIIYTIRFAFFVDVKNFFKNKNKEFKNIDIINIKNDKYRSSYCPDFNINAESFPVAIGISMIFYFWLFILTNDYKKKNFENYKYFFFNDTNDVSKRKFRIYYLLFPFILLYIIAFIHDILNDIKVKKIYNSIIFNWELRPIKEINLNDNKNHEFAHIYLKDEKYYFYSWKNRFISLERYDDYNYLNLYNYKNGKICGKDSFGNDLFFPNDLVCPINHIYIDNISHGYNDAYLNIDLGNDSYLHYTNTKVDGQILVDIKVSSSLFPLQLNSEKSNELCEFLKNKKDVKCKNYYKFNTIPFYSTIDTDNYNIFSKDYYELSILNDTNVFLYGLTYQGINSTSIDKKNILINYKKQMDILISLSICKNIFSGLNILLFTYFSIILLFEEKVKKSFFFYISISLIFVILCHLIIIGICFDINRKYIQSFMNKINRDFENNKISYSPTLMLIIIIIFYLLFYICIILYIFIIGNNSLYNLDSNIIYDKINNLFKSQKKVEKQIHKKEKSDESLSSGFSEKKESDKCLICFIEETQMIFAPCGHKCYCETCYKSNQNKDIMKRCPLCRGNVEYAFKSLFFNNNKV